MAEGKASYPISSRKREVREMILPDGKNFDGIIGLGGPSIVNWINEAEMKGFKRKASYEKYYDVYEKQMKQVAGLGTMMPTMVYDDIQNVPILKNYFYDFDLCAPITHFEDLVKKAEGQFTFTFSIGRRAIGKEETIKKFFELRNEKPLVMEEFTISNRSAKQYKIATDKGLYLVVSYRDGSPMLTITKK